MLLKIYLLNKRNNKNIRVKIIKEVYLVDSLKVKILLDIDVIRPEKINIITSRNEVYIRSCNIIVSINLKLRSRDVIIKSVVAEKRTTVLSRN